jgi:glycosyltransferase involved in cell wall biosynthesis
MRVLMVHCRYHIRGGEEESYESERQLLREAGIEVDAYEDDNQRVDEVGNLRAARDTVWSQGTYRAIRARLRAERHDVVHVHNFFPLISPAVYYAAQAEGCAVVQTLHNYRLVCPSAIFYRDGRICEDCLGKAVPWPGVLHACYRGSRAGSAVVAGMLVGHRLLQTWRRQVDVYVALNEFMRQKMIAGGLPAEKIVIKPNFVSPDLGPGDGSGGFALFAARLNAEKGVPLLLAAWERLGARIPLKILGDGPMKATVERAAARMPAIDYLGRRPLGEFYELLGRARFFVLPSTWYEGLPRVISECYARGTPIVASAIGAMAEVVIDQRTGLHFRPGDVEDLVTKVSWLLDHPNEQTRLREAARAEFEARYTAPVNLERLLVIYRRAIAARRTDPARSSASVTSA